MSEWRRHVMEEFPDRVGILSRASSLMDVWFTLREDLEGTYRGEGGDNELRDRIWRFAAWCFASERHHDVRNAVAVAFYEHIPHFGPARSELPRRLSRQAFEELMPAFRTTLTRDELSALVREVLTAQGATTAEVARLLAPAI